MRFVHLLVGALVPALTACSSLSPPEPLLSSADIRRANEAVRSRLLVQLGATATPAGSAPPGGSSTLLDDALAVAELKCGDFFARLGQTQQRLGFGRRETTLAGGAVASFLGFANATPKTIANTATVFALGSASMDAYEDAFLFSPDVGAVQTLVRNAQQAFRQRLGNVQVSDAATVARIAIDYEELCQVHTVRRLVNQSVSRGAPQATGNAGTGAGSPALPPSLPPLGVPPAPGGGPQRAAPYTGITVHIP